MHHPAEDPQIVDLEAAAAKLRGEFQLWRWEVVGDQVIRGTYVADPGPGTDIQVEPPLLPTSWRAVCGRETGYGPDAVSAVGGLRTRLLKEACRLRSRADRLDVLRRHLADSGHGLETLTVQDTEGGVCVGFHYVLVDRDVDWCHSADILAKYLSDFPAESYASLDLSNLSDEKARIIREGVARARRSVGVP